MRPLTIWQFLLTAHTIVLYLSTIMHSICKLCNPRTQKYEEIQNMPSIFHLYIYFLNVCKDFMAPRIKRKKQILLYSIAERIEVMAEKKNHQTCWDSVTPS